MSAAHTDPPPVLAAARALREGLRLAEHGYHLIPVTISRTEKGEKSARFHTRWQKDPEGSSDDPARIRDWSAQHACSFAIACGPSGVEGVDLDVKPARGVDAVVWWSQQGLPLGQLVVETPAGGLHTYWRRSSGRQLPTSAGEVAPGVDTRSTGGVFFAPGSFVLGSDGEPEQVGYTVQGELPRVADLQPTPDEVLDAWATPAEKSSPEAGTPDDKRPYTMDRATEWVLKYAINPLKAATEGERNDKLNQAAIVVGHFVPTFWDRDWAVERLTELANEIGLDPLEIGPTIRSGLSAGMTHPYTLVESSDPFASASDSSVSESDAFEADVDRKLRELRITEEARRRLSRERRADRPAISDGVIDDMDSIPEPKMLLGSLIPDAAVGFLAGRSGAYKSFLATSWACCIATGRPWLDRVEFAVSRPLKALYVAAEGAAGAAGRIRAWEADTGVSRRGRLLLYPRPIHLNDPAEVEELTEYVLEHGIEFLVIDTYHRSAPGTEENSSTDFGVVFEAVAALRDEHSCSSLFVDHTGAGKAGNPRGTSAKRDDADYVLSATYLGEEATAESQRELFVTKLKDTDTSGRWGIRLAPVEGQRFPVVRTGMIDLPDSISDLGQWWLPEACPVLPSEVMEAIDKAAADRKGAGRDAARWAWRLLASIGAEEGLTGAEIRRMLTSAPPAAKYSEEMVKRGLTVLKKAGAAWQDGTRYGLEAGMEA